MLRSESVMNMDSGRQNLGWWRGVKKTGYSSLHHHLVWCQRPLYLWLSPKYKPWLLESIGPSFLLQSGSCLLNTAQNGFISSRDVFISFLGADSISVSKLCSCLYSYVGASFLKESRHSSREEPKTWSHLFGGISHLHLFSLGKPS